MSKRYEFPDGDVIEICVSDTHSGPNVKSGQRVGMGIWWRRPGELWVLSEWRTMHRIVEWISLCENMQDFMDGEAIGR